MSVVDWDQPVAWHFLPDNQLCPVVFTKIVNGVRWAVVQRNGRLEGVPAQGRWLEDFHNVDPAEFERWKREDERNEQAAS